MRVAMFISLALLGSALCPPRAAAQSCQLAVINVHAEEQADGLEAVVDPDEACVCNGGWIVWLLENTKDYKINGKIDDWKDSHGRRADVVKFKKFGVFDDGSDENVDEAQGGYVKSVAFVARAQKEGTYHYVFHVTAKGRSSILDPQLEIKKPGGIHAAVCADKRSAIR